MLDKGVKSNQTDDNDAQRALNQRPGIDRCADGGEIEGGSPGDADNAEDINSDDAWWAVL